jgi:uncharacterized membrane protein
MLPFYVMLAAILAARGLGALGWSPLDDWRVATRTGLSMMFFFTAAAHFAPKTRGDLIRMVPPALPAPDALVTLTGLAELAGAVGLLTPLARWAAYGLVLLLVAMFPANIYAARTGHTIGGRPHTRMTLRLPLQLLWIALLWWSVQGSAARPV